MEENEVTKEVKLARLQRSADLTYREARAILCEGETIEDLAKEFGTTKNAIYNLRARARNKVAWTGYTVGQICYNDLGVILCGPYE